ncbi:hypothetical protein B0A52_07712 [Exophiala mesophila]|uniref:NYN domain-containing protein n=1 Tax=Exophiala mesophila TaxID=212818 RepID=A0A438MVJ6_EXOME|nr:hypothetical protein B0A52_07712 [Exophiala mesophila]
MASNSLLFDPNPSNHNHERSDLSSSHMKEEPDPTAWDFSSAINLLNSLSASRHELPSFEQTNTPPELLGGDSDVTPNLGDFSSIWDFLGKSRAPQEPQASELITYNVNDEPVAELDIVQLAKAVRWRDEILGTDLEDNIEYVQPISAATLRNKKRAERRARAKARADVLAAEKAAESDTTEDDSANELESLRRSPDRRAVIDDILGRSRRAVRDKDSPPTSPSPPKTDPRTTNIDWPVANPFVWSTKPTSSHKRAVITPQDGLTPRTRKRALISKLVKQHPDEKKYLQNQGLLEPAFTPLNVSSIGIHVFVDMSNISIGFHDCLKQARGLPLDTRLRRVPLSYHNFSLVLERGRPASKRVVVGSDRSAVVDQAKSLGYETNILERVHKGKEMTPRQKKYHSGGETSGSDANNTVLAPEKWVEQAVDEILHLKILESLVDAERPSTIVLATGDAAEAEYSGGFLRMVERALEKGWLVELVSFKMNTSNLYRKRDFRLKWGSMFKWVELDPYVEFLIDEE